MSHMGYHPWVVLHIPHDSLVIPDDVRPQFLLTDPDLALELRRMTDSRRPCSPGAPGVRRLSALPLAASLSMLSASPMTRRNRWQHEAWACSTR